MKKLLIILPVSLFILSCNSKNCYDCKTVWSVKTSNMQNDIVYHVADKSEEFCGTDEEMEAHEEANSFTYPTQDTIQGTSCILID